MDVWYSHIKQTVSSISEKPGCGGAVDFVEPVDTFSEVTAASVALVTLSWTGGFLVVMELAGGAAVGGSVSLAAGWAMVGLTTKTVLGPAVTRGGFGVTVAPTNWTGFTGSSCPTEIHKNHHF